MAFNEEALQLCYMYESSLPIILSELLNVYLLHVSRYNQSKRVLFMVFEVPCAVYDIFGTVREHYTLTRDMIQKTWQEIEFRLDVS